MTNPMEHDLTTEALRLLAGRIDVFMEAQRFGDPDTTDEADYPAVVMAEIAKLVIEGPAAYIAFARHCDERAQFAAQAETELRLILGGRS